MKRLKRKREIIVILRIFLNRFQKFYTVSAWKKNKNHNKDKFEIKWSMLRDKDQFKFFNGVTKNWGLMIYNKWVKYHHSNSQENPSRLQGF